MRTTPKKERVDEVQMKSIRMALEGEWVPSLFLRYLWELTCSLFRSHLVLLRGRNERFQLLKRLARDTERLRDEVDAVVLDSELY